MDIFLRVLTNFNDAVQKKKTDKQKFPKNILGDYIIMNINHPKDDVREKAKDLMIKFMKIFGNKIINKMEMVIDDKELTKIFQDKKELKIAYDNYKNNRNLDEEKEIDKDKNKINISNSVEGVFLTNVNKKFQNKNNKNKLSVKNNITCKINLISNENNKMIRSSSQPKIGNLKPKLKPIKIKRSKDRSLINSKSQIFEKVKK